MSEAALLGMARDGQPEAMAVLGQLRLDQGRAGEAYRWFGRAAARGSAMGLNMVGRCLDLGWGVAVDKARAAACYRVAAERGLDWAMYNYATLLTLGEGVAEDKPAALGWFRRAAALGNAKAINFVGSFHEDGWVVPRDLGAAASCYRRAAEGGDFRGMFNHARMLAASGRTEEAIGWLARCGEAATPAFRDKAAAWLATCEWPALRARGSAALRSSPLSGEDRA